MFQPLAVTLTDRTIDGLNPSLTGCFNRIVANSTRAVLDQRAKELRVITQPSHRRNHRIWCARLDIIDAINTDLGIGRICSADERNTCEPRVYELARWFAVVRRP